jgi:hypothetical protein
MKPLMQIGAIACVLSLSACALNPFSSERGDSAPVQAQPAPPVRAASLPPAMPDEEPARPALESTRRPPLTATGYAVIAVQNAKLPAQQRLLAIRAARIDAYRGLAEQVYGIYVDATTTIADLAVRNDAFRSRVEGVIHGATLASITPVNNDTYEVTLNLDRATVNDLRRLYVEMLGRKAR